MNSSTKKLQVKFNMNNQKLFCNCMVKSYAMHFCRVYLFKRFYYSLLWKAWYKKIICINEFCVKGGKSNEV
jgi:hypothetical protein